MAKRRERHEMNHRENRRLEKKEAPLSREGRMNNHGAGAGRTDNQAPLSNEGRERVLE